MQKHNKHIKASKCIGRIKLIVKISQKRSHRK